MAAAPQLLIDNNNRRDVEGVEDTFLAITRCESGRWLVSLTRDAETAVSRSLIPQ